jgi:hypothetical protein
MKTLSLLSSAALLAACLSAPGFAAESDASQIIAKDLFGSYADVFKKGRGKNGDGAEDDDRPDDDTSGSGRDKPRIPGGSGCDDPGDVAEHAECSG